jgi:hypothetical protein
MITESTMNLLGADSPAKATIMKPGNIITYVATILQTFTIPQPKAVQAQLKIANEATHAVVRSMGKEKDLS